MFYTESKLSDVYDYVINKRKECKRSVFDLEYLEDWLYWAYFNDYMFLSKNNGQITGVMIVIPVGRFDKHPDINELIRATTLSHSEETTDYFIMDALVDNSECRLNIAKQVAKKFPRTLTNAKTYVQKGDKIWIIPTKHNINFTKN